MNSLQIGMIVIGVLVIAILFFYQWWQTSAAGKNKPIAERAQKKTSELSEAKASTTRTIEKNTSLAIAENGRIEPNWEAVETDGTEETALYTNQSDQLAVRELSRLHEATTVRTQKKPSAPIRLQSTLPFDERLHVHAIITSKNDSPFDAQAFVAAGGRAQAWVRLFPKSLWEAYDPNHVGSAQRLILAFPLASRAGPIEPRDLTTWRETLKALSVAQDCEVQFFGFQDAVERAIQLDSFLAAVDIIPVIYLVKKDGTSWTGTSLRAILEANGFRLQSDGRFAYHEVESDAIIFYVKDGYETPFTSERLRTENFFALCCSLEPVRLARPLVRFDAFRQSLRALSKLLNAELKTSDGDLIAEPEFTTMRETIKSAMNALTDAGIESGSDTAHALFR